MVEKFDEFNEWLAIHQNFPYKPLSFNVSPLKPTINCLFVLFGCEMNI